ncbi:hypothetical protein EYF80_013364 [Liparis tanakae]|uniref:Uncharacterized protein n=1 Tax=Liparis tanakae TaxID=230148 RepID=A0A4Z2IEG4_9TELE|nr:hypothetical protein EYF80_013364 [Liparis tanakae]
MSGTWLCLHCVDRHSASPKLPEAFGLSWERRSPRHQTLSCETAPRAAISSQLQTQLHCNHI